MTTIIHVYELENIKIIITYFTFKHALNDLATVESLH